MTKKPKNIDQIGAELVLAAKNQTVDSTPLSTKLFPYIYVAQRQMSTRKISSWLSVTHGVSLSAAMISRSLNNEALHLERLAEIIAPMARYIGRLYGQESLDLLYGEEFANGPTILSALAAENHKPRSEDDLPRWEALQELISTWEPIPHEVKLLLKPYLEAQLDPAPVDDCSENLTKTHTRP